MREFLSDTRSTHVSDRQFIRYVLLFLHWGWALIIALPGNALMHSRAFTIFEQTGGKPAWLWRSFAIAVVALIGSCRVPSWLQQFSTFLQAAWLIMLAVIFFLNWPPGTGSVAYLCFASLAIWLVVRSIRDGDG